MAESEVQSRHRKRKAQGAERERYYLLPGQGGRAHRRKQRILLKWALAVALIAATILATAMYFLNRYSTY